MGNNWWDRTPSYLKNALVLHIEFYCVRYIIASHTNGAEKAQRHMEICQFLTAVFTNKVDPDRVSLQHPFYKRLHDGSQEFTDHLKPDDDGRVLAEKFAQFAIDMNGSGKYKTDEDYAEEDRLHGYSRSESDIPIKKPKGKKAHDAFIDPYWRN